MIKLLKTQIGSASRFIILLFVASAAPHAYAQSFEQVAVGASHICALDSAGRVTCTTTPIATFLLPPDDLPLMREIVAGQQHTCGITLDGNVECFGRNAFGVLDVPTFDTPVQSIAAGFNHTCAIDTNNQVQCWGLDTNGQLNVPDIEGGFVKLNASRTATCGIDTAGDIHCWTTDAFFSPDVPITGPFIDLATDSNVACGLTSNGDIECFAARERSNLLPPTSGPYTDLTVTNSAICGLRTDQLLDCSFAAPTGFDLDTRAEEYPLDVPFSSIERSNLQFAGVPICGIRAVNGTISCFGGSGTGFDGSLPAPPGADAISGSITASNITLALTAEVYGRNQVELFWNRVPTAFPLISVEVYRDDELLTTTSNNVSFYDNDNSISADESRYRIRTVDDAGNVGEFSNSIVVNRSTLNVSLVDDGTSVDNPRPDSLLRVRDLSVTAFAQFFESNDSFILRWSLDNPSNTDIAGFEIRINNEPAAFVSDTTFVGEGVILNECRIYSVAAIANDGAILDYAAAAFGNSAIQCPRVQ